MRFQDPHTCVCSRCQAEDTFPVRDLLALTAKCPHCGNSLTDTGLRMRALIDETATFFEAITIIMRVEKLLNITIPDEAVENIQVWDKLTLDDLVVAAHRSNPQAALKIINEAVSSAVDSEFPSAPKPLNFTIPLLDAICQPRKYGGY